VNKLKQKSIEKMKQSKINSQRKSQIRHREKLKKKMERKIELTRWYRNQGAVVTGRGEKIHHKFIKFCCAMYFEEKGYDYITEYKLKGLECDLFIPTLNFFIELETNLTKTKEENKLKQFKHILDSTNCDFFIFEIKDLPKNYEEVLKEFDRRFGL